jgi:hypothetical protein
VLLWCVSVRELSNWDKGIKVAKLSILKGNTIFNKKYVKIDKYILMLVNK